MLENLNHGGKVALLGLPSDDFAIDWSKVVTHMITIQGIYGRQMFETWYLMTAMLGSGLDVSPVITDRFPVDRWGRGVRHRTRRVGRQGADRMGRTVITSDTLQGYADTLDEIRGAGLFKQERLARVAAGPPRSASTTAST